MNDPFKIEEMLIRAATEFPDAEERARFLDCACGGGDDGLRARMEKSAASQKKSPGIPFSMSGFRGGIRLLKRGILGRDYQAPGILSFGQKIQSDQESQSMKSNDNPFFRSALLAVTAVAPIRSSKGQSFTTGSPASGFALVTTLMLMALLTVVAVGLLSLSAISLRATSQSHAKAVAQANARMALMLALGELQKSVGPDQRITAPSGILDSDPDTPAADGVANSHLTGVWNARDAATESLDSYNSSPPDYSRDKPHFQRWLVSNAKSEEVEQLNFANNGTFVNPTNIAGSKDPSLKVNAGKVSLAGGSYAWWVGDENCKAQINRRDQLAREANPKIADLLAGFATPGANGIKALVNYESFESNSAASDKAITRDQLALVAPPGTQPGDLFHDVTPYAQSILASVTTGSMRKDLSLYLGRTDIDWLKAWKNPNWQAGPLGPNGKIALSPLAEYDVLA